MSNNPTNESGAAVVEAAPHEEQGRSELLPRGHTRRPREEMISEGTIAADPDDERDERAASAIGIIKPEDDPAAMSQKELADYRRGIASDAGQGSTLPAGSDFVLPDEEAARANEAARVILDGAADESATVYIGEEAVSVEEARRRYHREQRPETAVRVEDASAIAATGGAARVRAIEFLRERRRPTPSGEAVPGRVRTSGADGGATPPSTPTQTQANTPTTSPESLQPPGAPTPRPAAPETREDRLRTPPAGGEGKSGA